MLIHGSCHCRNITFTLKWEPDPSTIPARTCTCTFCSKHGGVWTSCPTGTLDVVITDASLVSTYAFETRTADFHICSKCGVVPVVSSRIDGRLYALVSVNALEGIERSLLQEATASFGGEGEDARLSRRQRSWIPNVRFASEAATDP
jgi:hypothetical protein